MILHLGGDCFVKTADIIMILDYEKAIANADTGFFLKNIQKNTISENPKSIVVVNEVGNFKLFYSPISSNALLTRNKKLTYGVKHEKL